MLKRVRIRMESCRHPVEGSLYAPTGDAFCKVPIGERERTASTVEGRFHDDGTRISLSYKEGELSGMEGSAVTLSFYKSEPHVLYMNRTGSVQTLLTFAPNTRHEGTYRTPYGSFEVAVLCEQVQNALLAGGGLSFDYFLELKGAELQYNTLRISLLPWFDIPILKK